MVIGLTGPKLAGKGTAAEYLIQQHGAVSYSMSGVLSDIAQRLHLENSRKNLIAIATGLRSQFGENILAQVLKNDIEKDQHPLAVIDGIRLSSEVELFSQLPDFHLVYIDAPLKIRYERALNRGEKSGESEMTFEEFQAEEKAITEQQIASLQHRAHTTVINETAIGELYAKLNNLIQS